MSNILDHCVWSTIISCGHAVDHTLVIVFSLRSLEFMSTELAWLQGQIFLQHFICCVPVIIWPVLRFWTVWFSMPQLSCSAEGLNHTLPLQLHKIVDLNWEARCLKGVWCLSVRGSLLCNSWKVMFVRIA